MSERDRLQRQIEHAAQVRLARALDSLTVGFEQTRKRAEAEIAPLEPGDMAHHLQVDLKGTAGNVISTWDLIVTWREAPFLSRLEAMGDDDAVTLNPQFGFGYELTTDSLVMLTACVREWRLDDKGLIDSALVRLMACSPGTAELVTFQAVAHLSFTGYAAPTDDDDDGTATGTGGDWPSGGTDNLTVGPGWGGSGS